jgi:predicted esterase
MILTTRHAKRMSGKTRDRAMGILERCSRSSGRRLTGSVLAAGLLFAIGGPAIGAEPGVQGKVEWLQMDGGKLKAEVFESPGASVKPVLIIVLHGDAPFSNPSYQYTFAGRVATHGDRIAAAILRPGYTDKSGDVSDGVRGEATGDNYTPDRLAMIVAGIRQLQNEYKPRATMLVGHSGGAAISADILALNPGLAQAALLVSCPCDLGPWRDHMKEVHPSPIWDLPISSFSPLDLTSKVDATVRVRMIVGADDHIAPPRFTQSYANSLLARGIDVQVTQLPGKDHDILLEPDVEEALDRLATSITPEHK